jgi:hypothetical protein
MRTPPERLIAVDWSGSNDVSRQRKTIYLADWRESTGILTLDCERTRREVIDWVLQAASESPSLVVGFDFAFSFPADFVARLGCADADELWEKVGELEQHWRAAWPEDFWVVGGRNEPKFFRDGSRQAFRKTDRECSSKSIFRLGAGGVGWGSVAGQPSLLTLRRHGFSIWPFHEPKYPLAIEIYPAAYWRHLKRKEPSQRRESLASLELPRIVDNEVRQKAVASRDAFDALLSVAAMHAHQEELANLEQANDDLGRIEGRIWRPKEGSQSTLEDFL